MGQTKKFISTLNTSLPKAVPLQAWSGPEGSRKLRFPDFMTTAQDGGKLSLPKTYTIIIALLFVKQIKISTEPLKLKGDGTR